MVLILVGLRTSNEGIVLHITDQLFLRGTLKFKYAYVLKVSMSDQ